MRGRLLALCASAVLVSSAVLAGSQPSGASTAATWQPGAAVYGVSQPVTIPVTMDDGVVLSTEVIYPTDPSTGARASGEFPVLLAQNPYGDPAGRGRRRTRPLGRSHAPGL